MLCIDQLGASTKQSFETSLTMWKGNLIRLKHERGNITTPCATGWEAIRSTYSFDTFSTDCCLLYQSSLSPYHVFSSRVSEQTNRQEVLHQATSPSVHSISVYRTSSSSVPVHSISEHQTISSSVHQTSSLGVRNHQTSSLEFVIIRQVLLSQQIHLSKDHRNSLSKQHRFTSQQSKLHPTQTRAWLTTSRCHELGGEKMRWEKCFSGW
jgi:hypothetical protein